MKWKLRIPMMLFVFGLISGIHQYFPYIIIFQESDILRSIQYLGTLGIIFFVLEKSGIHEKKVNITFGLALIATGFLADYLTSY
ncbi:hypothetical protein ACFQ4X_18410 [Fictibacillus halophilus]|uniref:hypothetical protein n=1 Tax=Fictibacillus halophilus TaxID=1610490 RepID=UPI00363F90F3